MPRYRLLILNENNELIAFETLCAADDQEASGKARAQAWPTLQNELWSETSKIEIYPQPLGDN